ncbi:MAG: ferritin-like domain-containing protein [Geodermatophilaceae bacterium]|nr:ferritin-like domain-containing protein [Geodermatophilaceae bacterium]
MNTSDAEVEGLQAALRAEHSAIWGYGVVGASVSLEMRAGVRDIDAAHRSARDELADLVRARGADPDPGEASYELPFPVADLAGGLHLAAVLEAGVAQGYAFAVSRADTQPAKAFALAGLTDAALGQTYWQQLSGTMPASPEFPGL